MISEVMSFVCSDSCENGIAKEKVRTKGSGKLPFSEYLGFQSNGLEFSKCQIVWQIHAWTCATIRWKKKRESRSRIPRKDPRRMSMPAWFLDSTASPYLKVASPTRKIQSSSKLWRFQKWRAEIQDKQLGLTAIGSSIHRSTYFVLYSTA